MAQRKGDLPACVDCRHYAESYCHNESCLSYDIVSGRQPVLARDARSGDCGLEGKFFAKPRDLQWYVRLAFPVIGYAYLAWVLWVICK